MWGKHLLGAVFVCLTSAAAAKLSDPANSLWLSWDSEDATDRFFAAVQREFGPGGEDHIVAAPDAINSMTADECDTTAEAAFLNKVLSATGRRFLIAKSCDSLVNNALWVQIAANDDIAPMLYTLAGTPEEYPPNMVGIWLAFAPDNELGGFQIGKAACDASGKDQNSPLVFFHSPADGPVDQRMQCDQVLAGFRRGLTTCPDTYNYLSSVVNATGTTERAGTQAMAATMLTLPKTLGVVACADAVAAGVSTYWTSYNNDAFAAGLFVGSYGADPKYAEFIQSGDIKITINPLTSVEGVGVVRAVKYAAIAFTFDNVQADQSLVLSPVVPSGPALKQSLKDTVLLNYNPLVRPTDGGHKDVFSLKVDFTSIYAVKFAERTFEASGWVHSKFFDSRAVWNSAVYSLFPGSMEWQIGEIYHPNFVWTNRIANKLLNPQEGIISDGLGNFEYFLEFRGLFSCTMDIDSYPVDVQSCGVEIASREPAQSIVLKAEAIACGPETTGDYYIRYANATRVSSHDGNNADKQYSSAYFSVYFKHDPMTFVFGAIIPCIMLYLVGYGSLFLTSEPARAGFSIISLLNVWNVNKAGRDMTPVHVGTTWVDKWLLLHLTFAFLTLVECVISYHPKLQLPKVSKPDADGATKAKTEHNPLMEVHEQASGGIDLDDMIAEQHVSEVPGAMDVWSKAAMENDQRTPIRRKKSKEQQHGVSIQMDPTGNKPDVEEPVGKGAEDEPSCVRRFAAGPVLISKNYADLVMQRLMPIAYFICLIAMFVELSDLAQDYPDNAYEVSTNCSVLVAYDDFISTNST